MIPLLFISIVTLILVLLSYWILNNMEKQQYTPRKPANTPNKFKFETAQELFKYVEPDISEPSGLYLEIKPQGVHLNWDINPDDWQSALQHAGLREGNEHQVIRLISADDSFIDIEINSLKGARELSTGSFRTHYAVLGIKNDENFVPLFKSQPRQ
jgi:hypothetical protein